MKIYGKNYTKEEVLGYASLRPVRQCTLENGNKIIEVTTGKLAFTLVRDRGLDIADAAFAGMPVSFNTKNGITEASRPFPKRFFAGLLTTCGPFNVGGGCELDGNVYETHGAFNCTPAEDVCISTDWEGDELVTTISGKLKFTALFRENLVVTRTIKTIYGKDEIEILDKFENLDFNETEIMLLYHMNFGFPLLSEDSKVYVNSKEIEDFNGCSNVEKCYEMIKPEKDYAEEVFIHKIDGDGVARLEGNGVTMTLEFSGFPYLTEWKSMKKGDYALGLEPGLSKPGGRKTAKEKGELYKIPPMEAREFSVKVKFND